MERRAGTGSGRDSELPGVPLAGLLMLPSFVEAHWLSPTSADDDNGGGIFHAVRPVRLGQATTRRRVAAARGEASGEDACGSGSRRRCEERRSAVSLAVKVETNHELKLSGTMKYIDQKTDRGQTDSDNVRLRVGRLSLFISGGLSVVISSCAVVRLALMLKPLEGVSQSVGSEMRTWSGRE